MEYCCTSYVHKQPYHLYRVVQIVGKKWLTLIIRLASLRSSSPLRALKFLLVLEAIFFGSSRFYVRFYILAVSFLGPYGVQCFYTFAVCTDKRIICVSLLPLYICIHYLFVHTHDCHFPNRVGEFKKILVTSMTYVTFISDRPNYVRYLR